MQPKIICCLSKDGVCINGVLCSILNGNILLFNPLLLQSATIHYCEQLRTCIKAIKTMSRSSSKDFISMKRHMKVTFR